jgi:hypothetical protein
MRIHSKTEFKKLNQNLAVSTGDDFQRKIIPLLKTISMDLVETPRLKHYDRAGLDFISSPFNNPIDIAFQCKGFSVPEDQLGDSQISQCEKSINKFISSDLRVNKYFLVHNRDGRNQQFRIEISKLLNKITSSGKAKEAILLDRIKFLEYSFKGMTNHVSNILKKGNYSILPIDTINEFEPINQVPLKYSELTFNKLKLHSASAPKSRVADPADWLNKHCAEALVVLIGEFGFGKTTTLRRIINKKNNNYGYFFVPGAIIDATVIGSKDFFLRCINLNKLLNDFEETDKPTATLLLRPVLEEILKNKNSLFYLLIDGIDESSFLCRGGGLQYLFNILHDVKIPTILTMRTEYWNLRQSELSVAFSTEGELSHHTRTKVHLAELTPWNIKEITELTHRYRNSLSNDSKSLPARNNIDCLLNCLNSDRFAKVYSDIPKRPLFLRMLLDDCAKNGMADYKMGRAELMYDWTITKIKRDFHDPILKGGKGRTTIACDDKSLDDLLPIIWKSMAFASYKMTSINNSEIILESSCDIDDILYFLKHTCLLSQPDPIGLVLNSLLQPIENSNPISEKRVRFAHRAFQEFFLALYIDKNMNVFENLKIPVIIQDWINELKMIPNYK